MLARGPTCRAILSTGRPGLPLSPFRCLHEHRSITPPPIPRPTPFVPDVSAFLSLIGRNMSQHASKFTSWRQLFNITSAQLKELGVEPPRSRRYLLHWCQRFRNGRFGVGGDLVHVKDGVAELRVVEVASDARRAASSATTANTRKVVVNVDAEGEAATTPHASGVVVPGLRVRGSHTIMGPHVVPLAGGKGARITLVEGMWEDKRGRKVDGGERRKVQVRAKRRADAKKAAAR